MTSKLTLPALVLTAITAMAGMPAQAQAAPAPSPITDRASYTLSDGEWDALWQIEQQCNEVMCGERTSTVFQVDASSLFGQREWQFANADHTTVYVEGGATEDVSVLDQRLHKQLENSLDRVVWTLIHEKPSVGCWIDETWMYEASWNWGTTERGGTSYLSIPCIEVICIAESECATGQIDEVSADGIRRLRDCVSTARAIAAEHSNEPPETRLASYSQAIYELTDYADGVPSETYLVDSRPWTITSVFDGDRSTKAKCEGYSKALKLLVELSGRDDISLYFVGGTLTSHKGSILHMWCTVKMPDGRTYLSDITNNQPCAAGAGLLLVSPARGSVDDGYSIPLPSETVFYQYDEADMDFYDRSVLALADTAYVPVVAQQAPAESTEQTDPAEGQAVEQEEREDPQQTALDQHQIAQEQQREPEPEPVRKPEETRNWTIPVAESDPCEITLSKEDMEMAEVKVDLGWATRTAYALLALCPIAPLACLAAQRGIMKWRRS